MNGSNELERSRHEEGVCGVGVESGDESTLIDVVSNGIAPSSFADDAASERGGGGIKWLICLGE